MTSLANTIALVTGASRGVGRGIALALGDAGATVYITGRTVDPAYPTVPLTGTIHQTAADVTARGGKGIAIPCDHRDDEQVKAAFEQIEREQGRLDLLVNNAWGGYEGYDTGAHLPPSDPFWEIPLSFWDVNVDGARWTYVASVLGAQRMIRQQSGLIINISVPVPKPAGTTAYGVAKTAVDRITWDTAHQRKPHGVTVISLYPGLVRTETVMFNAQYFDVSNSESPEFTGRAVVALAVDPRVMDKTGDKLVVARLAQDYDFDDIDGKRPTPEF